MRTKIVSLAAALAFAGLAAPMAAEAQSYGYTQNYGTGAYGRPYNYDNRGYQYDPCQTQRQGRTGAGAVIGGGAGAVIGSQLAARGRRTEGSVLGGVVGALIGSQVGRSSSDNCDYRQDGYYNQGYQGGGYYNRQPVYTQPQYGYSQQTYGYYDNRYAGDQGYSYSYGYDQYDRNDYARDDRGYYNDRSQPVQSYQNSDGCRLAESEIRLPDGRRDTRYVRTCPDQYGRYRVVD